MFCDDSAVFGISLKTSKHQNLTSLWQPNLKAVTKQDSIQTDSLDSARSWEKACAPEGQPTGAELYMCISTYALLFRKGPLLSKGVPQGTPLGHSCLQAKAAQPTCIHANLQSNFYISCGNSNVHCCTCPTCHDSCAWNCKLVPNQSVNQSSEA